MYSFLSCLYVTLCANRISILQVLPSKLVWTQKSTTALYSRCCQLWSHRKPFSRGNEVAQQCLLFGGGKREGADIESLKLLFV